MGKEPAMAQVTAQVLEKALEMEMAMAQVLETEMEKVLGRAQAQVPDSAHSQSPAPRCH